MAATIALARRGSLASPDQLVLEGKAKEEFLNSARRGHEDDGGEGSVSERKGDTPEGCRFLPSPFGLGSHFLWLNFGERES